jgi:hypothetical protein
MPGLEELVNNCMKGSAIIIQNPDQKVLVHGRKFDVKLDFDTTGDLYADFCSEFTDLRSAWSLFDSINQLFYHDKDICFTVDFTFKDPLALHGAAPVISHKLEKHLVLPKRYTVFYGPVSRMDVHMKEPDTLKFYKQSLHKPFPDSIRCGGYSEHFIVRYLEGNIFSLAIARENALNYAASHHDMKYTLQPLKKGEAERYWVASRQNLNPEHVWLAAHTDYASESQRYGMTDVKFPLSIRRDNERGYFLVAKFQGQPSELKKQLRRFELAILKAK